MNIPTMSKQMFYKLENELHGSYETCLWKSIENAGKEEKANAIEIGNVDENGVPCITVYVDGSWSKRSYGTNYNSLSGMVGIIGQFTNKVLFVGVRNKYCCICARAESRQESCKKHACFKNWSGSAPAMEADIVVQGFCSSLEMHGVKYKEFIADGDSSVFDQIKKKVPYGLEVSKVECCNHVLKNYTKHLYKIKGDAQISLQGRKLLTKAKIEKLVKRAQQCIYTNASDQNVDTLRRDLIDSIQHVFGSHECCRHEICSFKDQEDKNIIQTLKETEVFHYIKGALDLVIRKANLLVKNENNNAAERLMHIVSRFNMGKRLNLVGRGSYTRRVWLSALRYNEEFSWYIEPWKMFTGADPGFYFAQYIQKQVRDKNTFKQYYKNKKGEGYFIKKNREKAATKETDLNSYGPLAVQPVDTEMIRSETERLIRELCITVEERTLIEYRSKGQFSNNFYMTQRQNRLTASLFGNIIKKRDRTPCHTIIKKCLYNEHFHSKATEYGIVKESVAIKILERKENIVVSPSGLWVDMENGFLAASPDGNFDFYLFCQLLLTCVLGLVGDIAIVEVKCLYSGYKSGLSTLEEIVQSKKDVCLEFVDGKLQLKKNHYYYYQIQGQLNITKRDFCYFVVYVSDKIDIFIEKVFRDEEIWKDLLLPKLTNFYRNCVAREIITRDVLRTNTCSFCRP